MDVFGPWDLVHDGAAAGGQQELVVAQSPAGFELHRAGDGIDSHGAVDHQRHVIAQQAGFVALQ